jgi:hypothetical protein
MGFKQILNALSAANFTLAGRGTVAIVKEWERLGWEPGRLESYRGPKAGHTPDSEAPPAPGLCRFQTIAGNDRKVRQ